MLLRRLRLLALCLVLPVGLVHAQDTEEAPPEDTTGPEEARSAQTPSDAPTGDDADEEEEAGMTIEVTTERDDRERRGTAAVSTVDLSDSQRETGDLGEALARSEGVTVQRTGGLGSAQRVALDGFGDDQIRVFLDGVPLEYTGLGTTLADVPTDLVSEARVYHGVVPIRYGADALGGAIDLVTARPEEGLHGRASLQAGSWGTYRAALRLSHAAPSGVYAIGNAFVDSARNDWPITVKVADLSGAQREVQLRRNHGEYAGAGGQVTVGVQDKPWAEDFSVTLMGSALRKNIPHNQVMTVPYGEAHYERAAAGATAHYRHWVANAFELDLLASYGYRVTRLDDRAEVVYDWYGDAVRDRPVPGELDRVPHDRLTWQQSVYTRAVAEVPLAPGHDLSFSITPQAAFRTGDERLEQEGSTRDPYEADQRQLKLTTALAWDGRLLQDRLQTSVFGKSYLYDAELVGANIGGAIQELTVQQALWGGGAAASLRLTPSLYLKTSYEYAARLPSPDEVFGDGVLISHNLELKAERSHNLNAGLQLVGQDTKAGRFDVSARVIGRFADELIVLMANDVFQQWQNVYEAGGVGAQGNVGWRAPMDVASLSGTVTWMELRNHSTEGSFAGHQGALIPNRPWLTSSGRARLQTPEGWLGDVRLGTGWTSRYVHWFYRGWEDVGVASSKQRVPSQLVHSLSATVSWEPPRSVGVHGTFEVWNLTDARTYDLFGVQRPGRTFSGKLTLTW